MPSLGSRPGAPAQAALAQITLVLVCLAVFTTSAQASPPTVRLIAASTTDPAITDVNGVHHIAIGPAEERIGRLVVFLPGTTARPQDYSMLIEHTTELGYHAIGLAYVNVVPVWMLCSGQGADCQEKVRREILLGTDESELVEIPAPDGVFHRLDALLAHLRLTYPDEDWDAYVDPSGNVRWTKVTVAGQSQGAGHAAFIGRLHRVARVVLFSGTEPALWTQAGDFATPPDDYHGLVHRFEQFYVPIQTSWDQIGLPGSPIAVEALPPPFGGSHQLMTVRQDCTGDPASNGFYHNCASVDGWMPLEPDGSSVYEPVWDHLFTLQAAVAVPALGPWGTPVLLVAIALVGWRGARRVSWGLPRSSSPKTVSARLHAS